MEKKYNCILEGHSNYYDLVEYLIKTDNQLEKSIYLKNKLKRFFNKSDIDNVKDNLNELIREFKSSNIPIINEFRNTIMKRKNKIINSFIKVD